MSWIDGERVKQVSSALGEAREAMDRLYYHSDSNAEIVLHANAVSVALNQVRWEARRNRMSAE
jgi:hypothetical protein